MQTADDQIARGAAHQVQRAVLPAEPWRRVPAMNLIKCPSWNCGKTFSHPFSLIESGTRTCCPFCKQIIEVGLKVTRGCNWEGKKKPRAAGSAPGRK